MKKGILAVLFLALSTLPCAAPLQAQVDDASRVLDQNKSGVLYLVALGKNKEEVSRGTAFVVGENLIIANYHVVAQAYKVDAFSSENKRIKVEGILGVNKAANLVLLMAKGKFQGLIIGNFDLVTPDMKLFALGANEAGEINIASGTTRNVFQITPELRASDLVVSLPLTFSGAPVIDISGQVVGVLTVLDRGLKFILPVNLFRSLSRLSKPVGFESWTHENFFETQEGSLMAGRIAAATGDTGNAQRFLEKIIRANPNNQEVQALLARVYNDQRDYTAAVTAYKRLLELDPNRAEAHFDLGSIYLKTQKLEEALAAFQKAQELSLNKPDIYYQLGMVYEAKKDWSRAEIGRASCRERV